MPSARRLEWDVADDDADSNVLMEEPQEEGEAKLEEKEEVEVEEKEKEKAKDTAEDKEHVKKIKPTKEPQVEENEGEEEEEKEEKASRSPEEHKEGIDSFKEAKENEELDEDILPAEGEGGGELEGLTPESTFLPSPLLSSGISPSPETEKLDSRGIPVEKHDVYLANGFFFLAVLLLLSLTISKILKRKGVVVLGLAGVSTLLGLFSGLLMRIASGSSETILEKVLEFNDDVFFFLLLPPIIFEGAIQLDPRVFMKNIGTVVWLAVIATLLSFLFVAGSIFLSGQLELTSSKWTLTECLAFATLISATDPVAVLALLKQMPGLASPLLQGLIAGESLLNDAICLVLYRSIVHLKDQSLLHALQTFFRVFVLSCALGAAVGFFSALVYKYT